MATRSLSEDELEAMEGKARKLTILDLKKSALAAKQGGDLETAMGCLKKAKKIESESNCEDDDDDDEPPYSSTLPLFWKKVALLCKHAGDIDRAKQALVHSKELEAATTETEAAEQEDSETKPLKATPTPKHYSETEPNGADAGGNEDLPPPPPLYDNIDNFLPPPPPTYDNILHNCQVEGVANEEEAAMLAELMGGGRESQEKSDTNTFAGTPSPPVATEDGANDIDADAASSTSSNGSSGSSNNVTDAAPAMTFTDEELMDEEMMMEFASGGVEGIPTQEDFASKVLGYKRLALKFKKEGNIPKATQHLRSAKQLEKVALALKKAGDGSMTPEEDPQSWLETLDPEESELLGELLVPSQVSGGTDVSLGAAVALASTTDRLTVEDLEEMDDDNDVLELVEMMGPNALPTVEEVTAKITEEKQKALKHKQEGNIEMAKTSLLKSKKIKLQAMRLAEIYRKLEARKDKIDDKRAEDDDGPGNDTPVSMEALEALMGGDPKPREEAAPKKNSPPQPPKDPWLLKPSSKIKAEVIRLKNEKHVKEAMRLLQLFKQKLAQEQEEADREMVAKMISTIKKRSEVCSIQRRLWQYYHWFGKETVVGADQYQEWTVFEKDCQKAIRLLNTEGSTSVKMAPRVSGAETTNGDDNPLAKKKLYLLEDDVTTLVESCTNDTSAAASTEDEAATTAPAPNFLEENALEVAILGLFQMEQNEKLQKILSKKPKSQKAISEESPDVRIHSKLQLPIQPEDPSKPLLFDLEPSDLSPSKKSSSAATTEAFRGTTEFQYGFDPSSESCRKQVSLPRKDPKHERALLRRMETKTLQLSVFCLHNQNKRKEATAAAAAAPKKKSWFFGRSEVKTPDSDACSTEGESKDIFLGKVSCYT
jgi:hypothetical protein